MRLTAGKIKRQCSSMLSHSPTAACRQSQSLLKQVPHFQLLTRAVVLCTPHVLCRHQPFDPLKSDFHVEFSLILIVAHKRTPLRISSADTGWLQANWFMEYTTDCPMDMCTSCSMFGWAGCWTYSDYSRCACQASRPHLRLMDHARRPPYVTVITPRGRAGGNHVSSQL
ncbi:hypothetical protein BDN72DRAFT_443004 [Pluteus cervinus]|uniref:Uncharacterized protein n=1 Tax=Pluteus cervinus TaxID=181527 RepID=A0ACD3BD03_9AGAR|nr:hypothetical protein BDN72DRAFT_443004 [Pluteus cervinus]